MWKDGKLEGYRMGGKEGMMEGLRDGGKTGAETEKCNNAGLPRWMEECEDRQKQ